MATIRDFLVESEYWEYSKEKYELDKSYAKIQLMERYLENMEFQEEMERYGCNDLPEGFFTEGLADKAANFVQNKVGAVEQNAKQAVIDKINKEKNGFLGKVIEIIKTIFRTALSFLSKSDEIITNLNKDSLSLQERLQGITLSASDIKSIAGMLWTYGSDPNVGSYENINPMGLQAAMKQKQPFQDKINLTIDPEASQDSGTLNAALWMLALILSNDTVYLNQAWFVAMKKENADINDAIDPHQIVQIIRQYINGIKGVNVTTMQNAMNTLVTTHNAREGIIIKVNSGSSENMKDYKQIETDLDNIELDDNYENAKLSKSNIPNDLEKLKKVLGATIRMMKMYIGVRDNGNKKLSAYLDAHYKANVGDKVAEVRDKIKDTASNAFNNIKDAFARTPVQTGENNTNRTQ